MTTKKSLVGFNPKVPSGGPHDFLAPVWDGDVPHLFGMTSGGFWEYGRVVFVGMNITANDVFAMLVDSGRKIDDVDKLLAELRAYLEMISDHRIGDVLELQVAPDTSVGFVLAKTNLKARMLPKTPLP